MGIGLYRAGDWMALRKSNKLSEASTAVQIYNKKTADNCNRSNLIKNRESRDNDDSPESTPVIIGFDVTASMGYLAKEIAVNSLNNMISAIIDDKAVRKLGPQDRRFPREPAVPGRQHSGALDGF